MRTNLFRATILVAVSYLVQPSAAEAFSVTQTIPDGYALAVAPTTTQIEIEFDEVPVLAPQSVRVAGVMSGLHEGTAVVVGNRIVYTVTSGPFFVGEMVRVNLHRNVSGASTSDGLTGGYYFTFTVASGVASANYADGIAYTASSIPYFIFGGDMDNDGTADVCAPNEGTNDVSIFLNTGGLGEFNSRTDYGVGDKPSSVFGEDFNNDGWIDIASADIVSGTMSVLINDGDGTLGPKTTYASGVVCRQVSGGDFDGDLDIDLVTSARESDLIYIFYNDGHGVYTTSTAYSNISDDPFTVRVEDFDRDGHADIVVGSQNLDRVDILLGSGTGSFTNIGNFVAGNGPWDTSANDLDGDGDCDLVVVNSFGNRISVLRNDGTGAMTSISADLTDAFPLGVHTADVDGDGDIDAISANFSGGTAQLFLNDGTGNLSLEQTLPVQETGSYPWAHDLDADGDLDITCVDEFGDLLWVFYNGNSATETPDPSSTRTTHLDMYIGPNPVLAADGTSIRLRNSVGAVSGRIVGVDGSLVRVLAKNTDKVLHWDGQDNEGRDVAPGVYYVRVESASGQSATGQIHIIG